MALNLSLLLHVIQVLYILKYIVTSMQHMTFSYVLSIALMEVMMWK